MKKSKMDKIEKKFPDSKFPPKGNKQMMMKKKEIQSMKSMMAKPC